MTTIALIAQEVIPIELLLIFKVFFNNMTIVSMNVQLLVKCLSDWWGKEGNLTSASHNLISNVSSHYF